MHSTKPDAQTIPTCGQSAVSNLALDRAVSDYGDRVNVLHAPGLQVPRNNRHRIEDWQAKFDRLHTADEEAVKETHSRYTGLEQASTGPLNSFVGTFLSLTPQRRQYLTDTCLNAQGEHDPVPSEQVMKRVKDPGVKAMLDNEERKRTNKPCWIFHSAMTG